MEITLIKQLDNTFKLAYDSDLEKSKKIKPNTEIICKITRPRNLKFHKKFFALINLVYFNQDTYNNMDHLRKDLTIAAGYYDQHTTFTGQIRTEAKSISFAKMDESEFSELYNKFIDAIVKYFHFEKNSINDEIEQYF